MRNTRNAIGALGLAVLVIVTGYAARPLRSQNTAHAVRS